MAKSGYASAMKISLGGLVSGEWLKESGSLVGMVGKCMQLVVVIKYYLF